MRYLIVMLLLINSISAKSQTLPGSITVVSNLYSNNYNVQNNTNTDHLYRSDNCTYIRVRGNYIFSNIIYYKWRVN